MSLKFLECIQCWNFIFELVKIDSKISTPYQHYLVTLEKVIGFISGIFLFLASLNKTWRLTTGSYLTWCTSGAPLLTVICLENPVEAVDINFITETFNLALAMTTIYYSYFKFRNAAGNKFSVWIILIVTTSCDIRSDMLNYVIVCSLVSLCPFCFNIFLMSFFPLFVSL